MSNLDFTDIHYTSMEHVIEETVPVEDLKKFEQKYHEELQAGQVRYTICPRNLAPFYILTSWTDSMSNYNSLLTKYMNGQDRHFVHFVLLAILQISLSGLFDLFAI